MVQKKRKPWHPSQTQVGDNLGTELLFIPETAIAIGISEAGVYRLIKEKRLDSVIIDGRHRVSSQSILSLLNGAAVANAK